MKIISFNSLVLLILLAGCSKESSDDIIEPEPITIISYPDSTDNDSGNSEEDNGITNDEQNLLVNGGLEEWGSFWMPEMLQGWSLPTNDYVIKDHSIVYEGQFSARMQSKEKGETARLEQVIPVTPQKKIRLRFRYYIKQWKDKGARTYCYFRTRAAESSSISSGVLEQFYGKPTYYIIRGGGYGLTFFPHDLNKWITFDEIIEVPPTATYFAFGINSYFGTTLYIDDCWITNVMN